MTISPINTNNYKLYNFTLLPKFIYKGNNITLYTNYLYIKGSIDNKYKEEVNNNLEIKEQYNKGNNNYKIYK